MAQVDRFSVTMSPDIGAAVREAAATQGLSVSSWLSSAAEQKLRHELLGLALNQYEESSGAFTDAELGDARRTLTKSPRRRLA